MPPEGSDLNKFFIGKACIAPRGSDLIKFFIDKCHLTIMCPTTNVWLSMPNIYLTFVKDMPSFLASKTMPEYGVREISGWYYTQSSFVLL